MRFGSIYSLPKMESKSRSTGEVFTLYRTIFEGVGGNDFSIMHEEIPPQHRASPPHSHTKKNEMYILLSGVLSVYEEGKKIDLVPGDFVVFACGGAAHFVCNEGSEIVEVLTISSCSKDDEILYADTKKKISCTIDGEESSAEYFNI